MGDCDYLNARVRAMGADLLGREFFEQVLSLTTEDLPLDALLASPYGPVLRDSLSREQGIRAVEHALRAELVRAFSRVRAMAPEGPRALIDVQLARWDLQNIIAVMRAVTRGAERGEIAASLLPAGAFPESLLTELASLPDALSVARALATWNYPFAFELHHALVVRRGFSPELPRAEQALYRAYYRWALDSSMPASEDQRILRKLVRLQIDLANIKAVLDLVRHRSAGEEPQPLDPIPGGRLPKRFLPNLAASPSLEAAFEALDRTFFAPGIEMGILAYGASRSLGVMERYLEEQVILAGCSLYRDRNPLSIAVPLGYLWRKYNETVNLRALYRGWHSRMPANAIRKELLLV
ncbi:MAG TPA: V-type ATPase subunit [Spirochaetia bacterium]|nr:V-type ATPase subunit [Spirochaetia bacterium]